MSARGYAASRRARGLPGGTLRAVQEAIQAERIPVRADGRIDPAAADQAWELTTDASRVPHTNGHVRGSGLPAAKTLESLERARGLKLANDKLEGSLIDRAAAELWWIGVVVQVRNALLAVPSRLKMRRPDLTREDLAAVDALIRETLEGLADRGSVHTEGADHAHDDRQRARGGLEAVAPAGAHGTRPSRGGDASAPPAHPGSDPPRGGPNRPGASARPGGSGQADGGSTPARAVDRDGRRPAAELTV